MGARVAVNRGARTGVWLVGAAVALPLGYAAYAPTPLHAADAGAAVGKFEELKNTATRNYENRIRTRSSPEKVFSVFASVEKDGEFFMTYDDFLRSVTGADVGYGSGSGGNPAVGGRGTGKGVAARAGLKHLSLADTDGDGLISFPEYMFFVTLLSIPESEFGIAFKMFDLDGNGVLDRDEFLAIMDVMNAKSEQGKRKREGGPVRSEGLVKHFFGPKGDKKLTFKQFASFLQGINHDILKWEFERYNRVGKGISAYDFSLSLVAHVDPQQLDAYIARADALTTVSGSVSWAEFLNFDHVLQHLDTFAVAVNSYTSGKGEFTKDDLRRAARATAGVELTELQIDIIFAVFDANGDGRLDNKEFVDVLRERKERGLRTRREIGFAGFVDCMGECWRQTNPFGQQ